MLRRVVWWIVPDVSEEFTDPIIRMMVTLFTNIYQTAWRNFPEDSRLHTGRRENLKSHINNFGV
jgi:hypothetical protein